jgi:AraC-like DNA-binding protein
VETLAVALPGLRAVRWSSDELYVGMKETYALARVESGRSQWWSGGKLWTSGPGSLEIQRPGDVHRDVRRDGPVTFQVISLPAHDVESVVGRVRVDAHLAAGDERGAALRQLHDAVAAGADRLELECAVAAALAALAALADDRHEHTRPVRRALELLRARLADPLTLDDLAAYAGLDKFHLCRAFRAQVGLPPHAYLTRLRIMHAKALLAAGCKPRDIAPQVGLYDQSQLNRHFRRIVGTTPGHFAKNHQVGADGER